MAGMTREPFGYLHLYRGRLGLSACPGWSRAPGVGDLEAEVRAIADWPARVVVSLMEDQEFRRLGLAELPGLFRRHVPVWLHLPIRDHDAPGREWIGNWPRARRVIIDTLRRGDNVLIHCLGGLGRTGTVAAMCVMDAEACTADEAIRRVRAAHSVHAVETPEQQAFLSSYRPEEHA